MGIQRGTGTEEATQELREGTVGWEMQLGLVLTRKIRGRGLVSCGSRHAREWAWLEMTAARGNRPFLWFMPASESTARDRTHSTSFT